MKVSDRDLMWRATSELEDWFSRLAWGNMCFSMVKKSSQPRTNDREPIETGRAS
jgi:hypothetical protein